MLILLHARSAIPGKAMTARPPVVIWKNRWRRICVQRRLQNNIFLTSLVSSFSVVPAAAFISYQLYNFASKYFRKLSKQFFQVKMLPGSSVTFEVGHCGEEKMRHELWVKLRSFGRNCT